VSEECLASGKTLRTGVDGLLIRKIETRWRFRKWFGRVVDVVLGRCRGCFVDVVLSHGSESCLLSSLAGRLFYTDEVTDVSGTMVLDGSLPACWSGVVGSDAPSVF
jgi:hypothetical protein